MPEKVAETIYIKATGESIYLVTLTSKLDLLTFYYPNNVFFCTLPLIKKWPMAGHSILCGELATLTE